jgi:hypothetical protein
VADDAATAATATPEPEGQQQQFRIGSVTINLPAGLSDEQRKAAIDNFIQSPAFEPYIDRDTGAPARVRTLVGSAPIDDRLANIQRFYPDARPYGDDNFLFTDPETGKATLYNPPGFDFVGDVASMGREISQTAFSMGGAIVGTTVGMLSGAPGGPPGMLTQGQRLGALGAGMGSVIGGELFDISANVLAGRIDTRSPLRRTVEASTEFFAAASGERVGEIAGQALKRATGGGKRAAQTLVQKFRRLSIDPPAGAVSTSRTIATLEKTLEASPFSADVMQKQAERVIGQTQRAADDIVNAIGTPQTTQGAGEVIKQAAVKAAERFGFKQEAAYNAAFDLIGPDTPVAVATVRGLRETMETELARAPQSLKPSLGKAIRMLRMLEQDAGVEGAEGLPFAALRQVRTMVGKNLDSPVLAGSTGAENASMKRVYAALTQDMSDAAKAASPEAAQKLAVADRYTRMFMNTAAKTLNKIGAFDTDERAFRYAMSAAKDGGTTLSRLRRNFTPEEWDTVAATVLNKMGLATPGAQDATGQAFSVNTFLTNWNRMSPEAKEALFGGTRYADIRPDLDTLVDVVSSLKSVERLANTSNTGRVMVTWMTIQALGGALAGMAAGGDVESGAAGAATAAFAPRMAAKLITHPAFVKWLVTPVTEPNMLAAHIGRLTAITVAHPEIEEEVRAFVQQLRAVPNTAGRPDQAAAEAK